MRVRYDYGESSGNATLAITNCTFSANNATTYGGAIYNYGGTATITMQCSRLVSNTAPNGSAIYNSSGTVTATNNWWGTISQSTIQNLFSGPVTYAPWIVVFANSIPSTALPGQITVITADFTKNSDGQPIACSLPDGILVAFNTTEGTITPTTAGTVNGIATSYLSTNSTTAITCIIVEPTQENYMTCTLVQSSEPGFYRLNWGCGCSDTGNEHIIIGSYNQVGSNQLYGWVFDQTSCATISPQIFGTNTILNNAVYNNNDIVNIATLTQTPANNYVIYLVTCSNPGSGFEFELQATQTLAGVTSASKVQWFFMNQPYLAVDTNNGIMIYPIDLSNYTFGTPISTINLADSNPSSFLYWLPYSSNLFLVQGYNNTTVATYQVDLTGTPTVYAGVNSDISGQFDQANSCATCNNYLVIGGSKNSQGTLVQYGLSNTGTLSPITAVSLAGASTVYYCERCCCSSDNNLLVGTDTGLLSYDADLTQTVASSSTPCVSVCWCSNSQNLYGAAITTTHDAFTFIQEAGSLTPICNPL